MSSPLGVKPAPLPASPSGSGRNLRSTERRTRRAGTGSHPGPARTVRRASRRPSPSQQGWPRSTTRSVSTPLGMLVCPGMVSDRTRPSKATWPPPRPTPRRAGPWKSGRTDALTERARTSPSFHFFPSGQWVYARRILGGARVLVVDDKSDIRRLLVTRLSLDPDLCVVGEAANGVEAIDRVRELAPEVVVLDLQMPVMSGEEVIPIVRSLEPRSRIVVFSAYVGVGTQLAGSGRPDAEVAKGTDLKVLVTEIHRVLDSALEGVVQVELGELDVGQACEAWTRWNRVSDQVRAATPGSDATDLLALVGVFLAVGDRLARATDEGHRTVELEFSTRREAALGAHRALDALDDEMSAALAPLHGRLKAGLAAARPLPAVSV